MAMGWLRSKEDDPDNNQGEFKPETLKADIDKSLEEKLNKFKADNEATLSPIMEMARQWQESRAAEQRTAEASRRQERQDDLEVTDDMYITNPREAIDRATKPYREQTQALAAITMRRELLGSKPYYTGELKNKIDSLIEAQPLAMRANQGVLDNCYYTIIGRHQEEINEGKYKRQVSAATFNSNSGTTDDQSLPENRKFNQEEARIMKVFGLDAKDVIRGEQELGYV